MNILVDENIEFAEGAFSHFGKVTLIKGRDITRNSLNGIDALIVRSVTNVNANLLNGTNIRFVGTATIGKDHIDEHYLKSKNIEFADALGCNAHAVTEYVFASLIYICANNNIDLTNKSIGIIGVGNIGSKIEKIAEALGLKIILCDPPLARSNPNFNSAALEECLDADIITLHVPLSMEGEDKTFHLLNEKNITKIRAGSILINTSRGAVIDNKALKKYLINNPNIFTVLDVWEDEPNADTELINLAAIATPHIAGYSLEGKVNGTLMVYNKLCKYLGREQTWIPKLPIVTNNQINLSETTLIGSLYKVVKAVYPINLDSQAFKEIIVIPSSQQGLFFDNFRKKYKLRREFYNYKTNILKDKDELIKPLTSFRLQIS